ncbi:MAG: hypothetical protein MJZ83_04710 [Bacteroidaceae bacterium]|nr:hypothetical protein [Bacteroidaceae bacterium]
MPNWCDTTYKCVGDIKEIMALKKALDYNNKRKTPLVKNGFGTMWLGCIINYLGGDWEQCRCRGEITDFGLENNILTIYQSTAWCEQEGFRQFIEKTFPSITVYYQEQEPGCEVFYTNSFDYFPEHYFLDSYEDWEYFESLGEAAKYTGKIVGHEVEADVNAIQSALDDYVEKMDDEDIFYGFHEFKLTK